MITTIITLYAIFAPAMFFMTYTHDPSTHWSIRLTCATFCAAVWPLVLATWLLYAVRRLGE